MWWRTVVRQFTAPNKDEVPWWETAWELAKPEIVRPVLGMGFSGGERNQFFLNLAGQEFVTLSGVSGVDDPDDPMGFAYLDYDHDGWLDILLATRDRPALELFRNRLGEIAPERKSVAVRFVGGNTSSTPSDQFTARDGYGAKVTLDLGETTIVREHRAGEGWRIQNSPTMLIGIGETDVVPRLSVRWPSGLERTIENVPAGSAVTAYENAGETGDGSGFEVAPYRAHASSDRLATSGAKGAATKNKKSPPLAPVAGAKLTMFTSMATWCPSCKRELSHLSRLRAAFGEETLAMVGVPVDLEDERGMLDEYVAENEPAYELRSDLSEDERTRFAEYVREVLYTDALPATILVTADGTPVHAAPGTPSLSKVRALLD